MPKVIPWWAKISAKLVLSRMPIPYSVWRRMGLFRHGKMDAYGYANTVFLTHLNRAYPAGVSGPLSILELGPGDSLATAVLAASLGHTATLVDVGNFAADDVAFYQGLAQHLKKRGLPAPDLMDCRSLKDILEKCHASYFTHGLADLKALPSHSIDLVWSQAVLEHVDRFRFTENMQELRRVLKPGGVCSHRVDLTDHFCGSLNNLRFSEKLWESQFFRSSGFYTNRIRFSEMIEIFERCGFVAEIIKVDRWDTVPLRKREFAPQFRQFDTDDLRVSGFDVILRPI